MNCNFFYRLYISKAYIDKISARHLYIKKIAELGNATMVKLVKLKHLFIVSSSG